MRDKPVILISDIHSNFQALTAVHEDLTRRFSGTIPGVINCGDILDYGADPEPCIELVKTYDILCSIVGNHDEALIGGTHDRRFDTPHGKLSLEITRGLVRESSLEWIGKNAKDIGSYEDIVAFHGAPGDNWENLYEFSELVNDPFFQPGKVYVFGHSHLQFSFRKNGSLFINPGSVGQPRNADSRAQYAILYPDGSVELVRIPYDIDGAADSIVRKGLPPFLATRLYLGI